MNPYPRVGELVPFDFLPAAVQAVAAQQPENAVFLVSDPDAGVTAGWRVLIAGNDGKFVFEGYPMFSLTPTARRGDDRNHY